MRSLRLDPELDDRVQRAAAREGESVSEFIRKAAAERADRTLHVKNSERLADIIGSVRGDGSGYSRRTGEAFTELLGEDEAHRRRR